jgi:hypothetical protein
MVHKIIIHYSGILPLVKKRNKIVMKKIKSIKCFNPEIGG